MCSAVGRPEAADRITAVRQECSLATILTCPDTALGLETRTGKMKLAYWTQEANDANWLRVVPLPSNAVCRIDKVR
jgi:hypothetical protein